MCRRSLLAVPVDSISLSRAWWLLQLSCYHATVMLQDTLAMNYTQGTKKILEDCRFWILERLPSVLVSKSG